MANQKTPCDVCPEHRGGAPMVIGEKNLSPVSILGEILADELDARGWTRQEFAGRLGMTDPVIADIVNGRVRLTPRLAQQIGAALGTSAEMWDRLDQVPSPEIR